MKWISRGFLLLGLFFVLVGMILPVNDRIEGGQRIGQDCEGPETVAMVLAVGLLFAAVGFGVSAWQIGWKRSFRDLFVLLIFAPIALGIAIKIPEVRREMIHNQSAEASCD
jgi:hypothetical protein